MWRCCWKLQGSKKSFSFILKITGVVVSVLLKDVIMMIVNVLVHLKEAFKCAICEYTSVQKNVWTLLNKELKEPTEICFFMWHLWMYYQCNIWFWYFAVNQILYSHVSTLVSYFWNIHSCKKRPGNICYMVNGLASELEQYSFLIW